jgi:hypothetical protein
MGKHYVVYKYLDEFYQHAKSYALGLQKKYGIFCLNGILQFTIFMSINSQSNFIACIKNQVNPLLISIQK